MLLKNLIASLLLLMWTADAIYYVIIDRNPFTAVPGNLNDVIVGIGVITLILYGVLYYAIQVIDMMTNRKYK